MEFDNKILNSHESAPLRDSFSNSNQHVCRYRGHGICDTVMEKSWKSHGILPRRFRGNPGQGILCTHCDRKYLNLCMHFQYSS